MKTNSTGECRMHAGWEYFPRIRIQLHGTDPIDIKLKNLSALLDLLEVSTEGNNMVVNISINGAHCIQHVCAPSFPVRRNKFHLSLSEKTPLLLYCSAPYNSREPFPSCTLGKWVALYSSSFLKVWSIPCHFCLLTNTSTRPHVDSAYRSRFSQVRVHRWYGRGNCKRRRIGCHQAWRRHRNG